MPKEFNVLSYLKEYFESIKRSSLISDYTIIILPHHKYHFKVDIVLWKYIKTDLQNANIEAKIRLAMKGAKKITKGAGTEITLNIY